MPSLKRKSQFKAKAADGTEYTINVFAEMIPAGTRGDPLAMVEGMLELKTTEGEHVNFVSKGKYEILALGPNIEVTTDDPNAPHD